MQNFCQQQSNYLPASGRSCDHFKVRVICVTPMCARKTVIHVFRSQSSRRTISLLVTNPRITEWPRPGTVRSEALPLYPVLKFKERKICGDFLKFILDKRSLHNRYRMNKKIQYSMLIILIIAITCIGANINRNLVKQKNVKESIV